VGALLDIAAVQVHRGEREAARSTFTAVLQTVQAIQQEWMHISALRAIATIQAQVGFGEQALRTAEAILTDRNEHLPEIAKALVEVGDRENFKRLLVPCAYYLDAAYRMCGLLARVYPEQASAVAEVVREFR
jgi:hypothetical protein